MFRRNRLGHLIPGRNGDELDVEAPPSERGRRLREMLDELGPTFVKFGQLLSMRPDILPPDIIAELRSLQDDVRPFSFELARQSIEEQARRADRAVVPRVRGGADGGRLDRSGPSCGPPERSQRRRQGAAPGAPRQIEADLSLLYQAARLAKERVRALDFIDTHELVDEFARSIRQELDYRLEARNADTFRRNFAGHPHVKIPRVYWSYTRTRVLTLEYLEGTQVADADELDLTIDDRRRLAYLMTEAWMTMIFRHGFFHGDPHPANVLVLGRPDRIGLVDFGLAGKLTDSDISKATRLFIDAANENVDVLPKRLADLGVRYPPELEEQFVAELRELFYRYYGARLSDIDPLQVIREGFALIYRVNLKLPTRFLLVDRAVATLGSVGIESPGVQRLRGREAVRAQPDDRALRRWRIAQSASREAVNLDLRSRASCRTRCTTRSSSSATARSRSASSTRAWKSSCRRSTSSSTARSSR